MFAVASARAKAHLEQAVADDPELARLLDEVQRRELDPLTAVREILEKVFKIQSDGDSNGPTLADIEAARERHRRPRARHAGYSLRDALAARGPPRLLKAENLQRTGSFKIRGAVNKIATLSDEAEREAGVVDRERREPRPGGRLGGARGGRPGDDLHAAGRADGEGGRDAQLRGRGGPRRGGLRRGERGASESASRPARRSSTRSRTRS